MLMISGQEGTDLAQIKVQSSSGNTSCRIRKVGMRLSRRRPNSKKSQGGKMIPDTCQLTFSVMGIFGGGGGGDLICNWSKSLTNPKGIEHCFINKHIYLKSGSVRFCECSENIF